MQDRNDILYLWALTWDTTVIAYLIFFSLLHYYYLCACARDAAIGSVCLLSIHTLSGYFLKVYGSVDLANNNNFAFWANLQKYQTLIIINRKTRVNIDVVYIKM